MLKYTKLYSPVALYGCETWYLTHKKTKLEDVLQQGEGRDIIPVRN
jgi:hypothetical protein